MASALKKAYLKGDSRPVPQVELALIQKMLPDEMLLLVLSKLPITALGAAQCVCRHWRMLGNSPCLWQRACLEAFYNSDLATNCKLVRTQYRCGQADNWLTAQVYLLIVLGCQEASVAF
jgi:hypothetical protein